ncbi:MAG TPA: DnaJ domain-containing protein [Acetobacteraceae bacterium]|nr:DnaJ domain-containing protein [Acetobacteraceae bacterium]
MLFLALGGLILVLFLFGLRAFERASVGTVKSFGLWVVALGGLSLALLLVLTGRAGPAMAALTLLGPAIWNRLRPAAPAWFAGTFGAAGPRQPPRGAAMSREEAYEVLGLRPGASAAEIREAHRRLMRAAHPDSGGSDWLASRINAARDTLLGGRAWRG